MTENTPQPEHPQTWGAPQPAPSAWSAKKTAAAIGIAAAIAAAGGGVIYAATSGNSQEQHGPGGMGGPGMGMMQGGTQNGQAAPAGGPGEMGEAPLHGEFVASDGNGGYRTQLTQTGAVTAVSPTSITVKSADNYTHTYRITTATNSSATPAVGDIATIDATETNGTATATAIRTGDDTGPGGMSQSGFGGGRPRN